MTVPAQAGRGDGALPDGAERRRGLVDLHVDAGEGRVWLELPKPDDSGHVGAYLLVEGLRTGLGSNPVGLDRGQLGGQRVVDLRRVGGQLLVEERNLSFRAQTDRSAERIAVRESFASSVVWAGPIVEEGRGGSLMVDFTSFVVRDAHGVARRLQRTGQGAFSLDRDRSVLDPAACLAFPDNVVFEAVLTFAGNAPGSEVRAVAPSPDSVTLVQAQTLIRLPDDGYEPRRLDPRVGAIHLSFRDYAAPLDGEVDQRWILRHRLEKTDPSAERSEVREPIVYYVDPGTPEPVRSALIEGASWWAEAFEHAGFVDAFRVELLPEGAHPLDVRYNVIQWVHRATRGWSYGGSIHDPRTGEILQGHVTLGSLRIRHDRQLFEGLAGTAATGSGSPDDPIELALARIRQLSAHEVGHTLGLPHNFAASTYGRASVMDYPAPLVQVRDGALDFSDAYGVGVGAWDRHAIRWAYAQVGDEALDQWVREAERDGLLFLSDVDARPSGAAHPAAGLWDNGADPIAELARILEVRSVAIDGFGADHAPAGTSLSRLREVFAMVYLHHRYQLAVTAKTLGGVQYRHAVVGEDARMVPIDADRQRRALDAILQVLTPARLDIPDSVIALLHPPALGAPANREHPESATAPAFDAIGLAGTAATMAVRAVLDPARCARLVDQHRRDASLPSLEDVLTELVRHGFSGSPAPREAELAYAIQRSITFGLIELAANADAAPQVRFRADQELAALRKRLAAAKPSNSATRGHHASLVGAIKRHLDRRGPAQTELPATAPPPPGSPIGAGLDETCGFTAQGDVSTQWGDATGR